MKLRIALIGKVREKYLLEGEAQYLKRLSKYTKIELLECKDNSHLLKRLDSSEYLVALDEKGKSYSSIQFAKFIEERMLRGPSLVTLAIGGATGWDDVIKKRANLLLSLSDLTFPHQMVRLIILEQLYRAFTILKGEPYHKQ